MEARMKNPAVIIPDAMRSIQELMKASRKSGISLTTLELVHLRVSQINSCLSCIDSGTKSAIKNGESGQRLDALSDWRFSDLFDPAEKAALEIAECISRLADQTDAVPDHVWEKASAIYDEKEMASLILWISITNLFNRLNVSTRQIPGVWE